MRLLAYQLLQGVGGCHINSTAVHSRLDNLGRRVGHLETLAQERCVVDYVNRSMGSEEKVQCAIQCTVCMGTCTVCVHVYCVHVQCTL